MGAGSRRRAGSRRAGVRVRCAAVRPVWVERGQSLAELAIILPLILVLVVGVVEVSAAFNAYISVISAARDGARLGSKGSADDGAIQALVVKDLGTLRQSTPLSNVTVTHLTVDSRPAIEVQACYDHKTLLHVPIIMPDTFHMCSSTTMPSLQ